MGIIKKDTSKTSSTTYMKYPRISNHKFVISTLKWRKDRERAVNRKDSSYNYTSKSYDNIQVTDQPATSKASWKGFDKPKPKSKSQPKPKDTNKPKTPPPKKMKTQNTSMTDFLAQANRPYRPLRDVTTQPTQSTPKKGILSCMKSEKTSNSQFQNSPGQNPLDLCKCSRDEASRFSKYIYPIPLKEEVSLPKFPVRVVYIKEPPLEDCCELPPCEVPIIQKQAQSGVCTGKLAPESDQSIDPKQQQKLELMKKKEELKEKEHQRKMEMLREKNRLALEKQEKEEIEKKEKQNKKRKKALLKKIVKKRKRCMRSRKPCRYRDHCLLDNLRCSEIELIKDEIAYGNLMKCVAGFRKMNAPCSSSPCPRTSCSPGCTHAKIPKCDINAVCTNYPCSSRCRGECWKEAALKWTICKKIEFVIMVIITSILLWVCFGLMYHWIVHYRYGFHPPDVKDRKEYRATREINRHILYSTGGLLTISGFSIIIYRTLRWLPRCYASIIHGLLSITTLVLLLIGFSEAKAHNKTMEGVGNFHLSFHNWVGHFTIAVYFLHMIFAVIVFLILGQLKCCNRYQTDLEAVHKAMGLFVFICAVVSCGTGVNYYGFNLLGPSYLDKKSTEATLLNSFSICMAVVTVFIFLIVSGSYNTRY